MAGRPDLFSDIVLVPAIGFPAAWPQVAAQKELSDQSDRDIHRLLRWLQHEQTQCFERVGMDGARTFQALEERARAEFCFYHPGHPTGSVFADMLRALPAEAASKLPCLQDLISSLSTAQGIYQISSHPVPKRVVDLVGLRWATLEYYLAWQDLVEGERVTQAAVDRAREVKAGDAEFAAMPWPVQAHFTNALGLANLKLGRQDLALDQLCEAARALKGLQSALKVALRVATASNQLEAVEPVLIEVAPHLQAMRPPTSSIEPELAAALSRPEGRRSLARVRETLETGSWLAETLDGLQAAA